MDKTFYEDLWEGKCRATIHFKINGKEYAISQQYVSEEKARLNFPKLVSREREKMNQDNKYSDLLNNNPTVFHKLARKINWKRIAFCMDGDSPSCVMESLKVTFSEKTTIDKVSDLIYEINSDGGLATTLYIGRKENSEISDIVKSMCLDEDFEKIIADKIFLGLKVIKVDQESYLKVH